MDSMPAAISVVAGPDDAGSRTDRFLAAAVNTLAATGADGAAAIGTMSRTRVKSLIVDGAVLRDGVVLRDPSDPVRAGACFVLQPPAVVPARPEAQAIPFAILYEDRDIIVLDKPAGLVVHPAPGNEDGTLVNALLAHCRDSLPGIGGERRPGIVHRLDKDTSGVMVVAKTEQALATLSAAFAARDLDRQYVALVWGVPAPAAGGRGRGDRARPERPEADGDRVTRRQGSADPLSHDDGVDAVREPVGIEAGDRSNTSNPCAHGRHRTSVDRGSFISAPYTGCGEGRSFGRSRCAAGFPAAGAACGTAWFCPSTIRKAADVRDTDAP